MALQEIPGQKQAEDALTNLVGQGVLGSLCVVLIVALYLAVKALLKAKDDRFNDQRLMTEALQAHNEAAKELAIEMNKSAANLVIDATKNQDTLRNTLSAQERSLDDLTRAVNSLQQENVRMAMTVANFRCSNGKVQP